MKLIVISDIEMFAGEANIVNQLFDNGLLLFHLRKYNNSKSEVIDFIRQIKSEYRSRIVLHQFQELANEFGIARLHFSEMDRKSYDEKNFTRLKADNKILSTSVHSLEEFNSLSACFEYTFLSPVFDSISKADYKASVFDLTERKAKATKLVALGGIKEDNCLKAMMMGFDGVALLGAIWKSDNKVESFKNISHRLTQIQSQILAENSLRNFTQNAASLCGN